MLYLLTVIIITILQYYDLLVSIVFNLKYIVYSKTFILILVFFLYLIKTVYSFFSLN